MLACDRCWRWPAVADDIERLAALVDVVRRLRSPQGCPWDREQTHASLRATLLEEVDELRQARTPEAREAEFGDLLFTMVNVARKLGINPEDALRGTTGRFEARFRMMEQQARADGRALRDLPIEDLDRYWEAAKRNQ